MLIIFLLLSVINTFVLATLNIYITDWQYWVSLCCVNGAYLCGSLRWR